MLKNLFKSVKKLAKKAAPYAGLVAGAMGMSPWAAAGLGALIGGIGGGSKGAIGGGLGGYFGGSMFGQGNPLFGPKATGTGFFNFSKEALNKGVMENLGEALINKEKEGFMKYLPMVMAGSGLTYAMGGFDEDPIPEDAIPKEYEYDPDKDPLKNINKKFTDLYEQYVAIPSTSIYGHLQSLGKLRDGGGVASFAFGGSPGGRIMGPGTGREDNIPGLIMDPTTGQTSDMVVSNNEHIVPEYTLYAMGGGDTEKGHEMLNQLRKKTRPMAANMGYDFTGAEQGKVMYG